MNIIFSRIRTAPPLLLAVLALGLIVRTLFISIHERPLISDEREYDQLAYSLSSRGSYAYDATVTAYRPPGYPFVVGALYWALGHHPIAVKFFQGSIDVATALLIYLLLVAQYPRGAIAGVLLWTVFPPAVLYTNFLMTETVFTFILLLVIVLFVQVTTLSTWYSVLLGASIGALALMKPGASLLIVVPFVLYRKLRFSPLSLGLVLASALLVVAPWIIRNRATFGEFAISSNGGINLLIGNHPAANGAYNLTFDPSIMQGAATEFEAERKAAQFAWRYIADNPGTFLANAGRKLAHFFESEGGILVWSFHPAPESLASRFSPKYRDVPSALTLIVNLPYMLILVGGLWGFLASKRDPLWWVVLLVSGIWLSIHLLFFGGSRFHFPLMAIATIYATTLALKNPLSTLRELPLLQQIFGIMVTSLLIALWTFEAVTVLNA